MKLELTVSDILDPDFTVSEIIRLAKWYKNDLKDFPEMGFFKFYNYVRDLEYIPDPPGKETLSRFVYTIRKEWKAPRDCDDKTILISTKCEFDKIPYRVVVCGMNFTPHHVYPEILVSGKWMSADATYWNRNAFGKNLYQENYRKIYYPKKF